MTCFPAHAEIGVVRARGPISTRPAYRKAYTVVRLANKDMFAWLASDICTRASSRVVAHSSFLGRPWPWHDPNGCTTASVLPSLNRGTAIYARLGFAQKYPEKQ